MTDIYNLLIPEERADKDTGETRTFWHKVGTVFPHRKGDGFNVIIPDGISVSGRVMILPRSEKGDAPDKAAQDEFNEQGSEV
ncbi:MAG: hypothetical protein AAFS13_10335 [Pseudomonadota bacterium]